MTTLPVAMAAGIGLFLVFLVFLRWHTSPRAIPAVVLPLAFTPLAFSCLFASRAVINGFRAMAAGEPGALASVLGTMAQANGFVLSTQLATGAVVVLHLAFALILLRREQSSPKPPIANTAGFLSLGSTGLVLL